MSIYIMFAVMLIINAPATTGPRCCDQHSEGQLEDISKQGTKLSSCDRYWNHDLIQNWLHNSLQLCTAPSYWLSDWILEILPHTYNKDIWGAQIFETDAKKSNTSIFLEEGKMLLVSFLPWCVSPAELACQMSYQTGDSTERTFHGHQSKLR